jgi:hypothetical protein
LPEQSGIPLLLVPVLALQCRMSHAFETKPLASSIATIIFSAVNRYFLPYLLF